MRRTARSSGDRQGRSELWSRVGALAYNLWWTWNPDAQALFAAVDPVLWEAVNHNPIELLSGIPVERRRAAADDPTFLAQLDECEAELARYLKARTWSANASVPARRRLQVAYFCAEYGLHECLPQYAGGLGVLAGDHLKSASDLGVPLVAVGLLYRCGYCEQRFGPRGDTRVSYPELEFGRLPIRSTGRRVSVPLAGRGVWARIWRVQVGRVPLYLLDADVPENRPADRAITRVLYGGDERTRIEQEIVLGVGGVLALEALGIRPNVYHLNEGHAAFCTLARLWQMRRAGWSWERAQRRVRASTVFTTHTPVPAGHDRFAPALALRYLRPLLRELGLSAQEFLALGRENASDRKEPFCMTVLALRLSDRCNGVSRRHGEVSREMWQRVYSATRANQVPIDHVTNGVHVQTWMSEEMQRLCRRYLKPRALKAGAEDDWCRAVQRIPPAELWQVRCLLRRRLVHFVRGRLAEQIRRRLGTADELAAAYATLDENALTIGFARRFATYKRAPLIFRDARRLARLLNDPVRPVQLVFAGKAHPRDAAGQAYARRIYKLADRPGLRGRVVLLEDYDMHMARVLVAGCDVWLNTPLPPQEASGTSGMKAALNGGLNCSILDGWWCEGYGGSNGWAFGAEAGDGPGRRDAQDAEQLYRLLEGEVVPLFYRRDRSGIPRGWVRRMVASMRSVCARFGACRMVGEYVERYAAGAGVAGGLA